MAADNVKMDIYGLDITITSNNIHIENSYRITRRRSMKEIFSILREYLDDYHIDMDNPLYHRSIYSLCNEWVAHNNCYRLGLWRDRTRDCDLNYPQPCYMPFVYWLTSRIVL